MNYIFISLIIIFTIVFIIKSNISAKQTIEKELVLKKIIGDIKLSQSVEEIYSKLIIELSELFNLHKCFFIEDIDKNYPVVNVKYENMKNPEDESLKKSSLPYPASFLKKIVESIDKNEVLIIENTNKFFKNNILDKEFFRSLSIQSLIAVPFIRYNHETKVLGTMIMTNDYARKWNKKELKFLNLITNNVISIIWDMSKIFEFNKLRDSIIITLAHDLQVPLIGEHTALKFLFDKAKSENISGIEEILEELINNNEEIIRQLKTLLDIYYYEANKKVLNFELASINKILNNVINALKEKLEAKNLDISLDTDNALPLLSVDIKEIEKVTKSILMNAIKYSPSDGAIAISTYTQEGNTFLCISDNGPGIKKEIAEKIFERFNMAQSIERKLGSGFSLYLSKLILKAHNGSIYLYSEKDKGTTVCIILPIKEDLS